MVRMRNETEPIYPNSPTITRLVDVGDLTKPQLIQELQRHSISMNESAERLFADDRFTTSGTPYKLKTVELTVRDLGFPEGATTARLFARANELGLELCPLELHLSWPECVSNSLRIHHILFLEAPVAPQRKPLLVSVAMRDVHFQTE